MVRLKGVDTEFTKAQTNHFNSTMVRLKECLLHVSLDDVHYFNSTMVRLKGIRKETGKSVKHISIPLWYD